MGELSVSLLRLGYLLVLWLFVLAALVTLRRDIYGTTIERRGREKQGRSRRQKAPVPVPAELAAVPAAVAPGPAGALGTAPARRPSRASVSSAPRPGAPSRVVVKNGPLRGTTLPLARSAIVVGRSSSANLVLDDEFASGRHAQIVPRLGGWFLEDLGSTNGTFMGRERIAEPRELTAGDSIRIGNTTLEVLK
ncbi:MAG: FHA domain-containing protein [Bifidobacteriaceae bacterium]|jgi:hypothetical protein|nr:FHA domain-containing protein [Bifidobacteriaceae bacterium]